eukprot:10905-Amphidinium_carterae.1
MFRRYADIYDGLPHPQEEPTPEQLSALKDKFDKDTAPDADFGVWGPYGRRQQKLFKFNTQVFVGGELVTKSSARCLN